MKKLSICIPTWNRCTFIIGLLNNISEQAHDEVCDEIEICISDNASTDNTRVVVEHFIEQHRELSVRYSRNPINNGELNLLCAAEMATGEYCWLIGDDDLLAQGGLRRILHELYSHPDLDMIITALDPYNSTMDTKIGELKILNDANTDRVFDFSKREDLLEYLKNGTGVISIFACISNVVFKQVLLDCEKKKEKTKSMAGTSFIFVWFHLETILSGAKMLYIVDSIIHYRRENMPDYANDPMLYSYITTSGLVKIVHYLKTDSQIKELLFDLIRRDMSAAYFQLLLMLDEEIIKEGIDRFYMNYDKELFPQVTEHCEELKSTTIRDFLEGFYGDTENRIDTIEMFLKDKNVVIFGAGSVGQMMHKRLADKAIKIHAYSDNNNNLWGTQINDLPVIPPEEMPYDDNTAILITFLRGYKEEEEKLHFLGYKNTICYIRGN